MLPQIEELTPAPDVPAALRALRDWPNLLLIDSSRTGITTGRFSFLMADPFHFEVLQHAKFAGHGAATPESIQSFDPLIRLQRRLETYESGLVEGLPLPEAVAFANAAAALSTTRPGAQDSMPSRAEVDRFLLAG